MAENLEIVITATDKASSVFGSIGKAAGGALKLGLIGAGAAVAGLGAGLALALNEAMEAQAGIAQLDAVLVSTGGAAGVTRDMALDLADSLSGVTRFSDDAVLAGENMLLTFTNIGKDVFPEATQTMLDMSQALGQDVKSSAIQLGKALNDPVQGITALQRVGVTFTEEQKNMVAAMVDAGDTMGAQKFILAELSREFGGSAEAAGQTFAGQLDILKNSLLNVAEGVGMAVMPMLQALMDNVIMPMVPAIQNFAAGLQALIGEFTAGAEQGGVFGGVMEVLDNFLSDELIETIWTAVDAVQAFIADAWAVLLPWLRDFIPKAIAFLAGIWETVLYPAIQFVWNFVATVLVPLFQNILVPILQAVIPAALQVLSDFWTNVLKPAIEAVWAWMNGTLMPFLQNVVVPWLSENIPAAIQTLSDFWTNTLKPAIEVVWNWMSTVLMPFLVNTVVPFLETTFTAAIQALSDFWTNTLQPALEAVWEFIQDPLMPIFNEVISIFDGAFTLAINALSKLWKETLKPALEDVWKFIDANILPILESVRKFIAETLGPAIGDFVRDKLEWWLDKLQAIHGWLDKLIGKSGDAADALNDVNAGGGGGGSGGGKNPKQHGGPVYTGLSYLVGERGPELFVPRTSGTIIPAGATAALQSGAMGGTQISIYGGLHLHGVQNADDLLAALSEYMV